MFLHVAWGRHQDHPLQHHLWGWDPVTLKNPPGQNSALLLQPIWQPETYGCRARVQGLLRPLVFTKHTAGLKEQTLLIKLSNTRG